MELAIHRMVSNGVSFFQRRIYLGIYQTSLQIHILADHLKLSILYLQFAIQVAKN
jgi:hypothetical protein